MGQHPACKTALKIRRNLLILQIPGQDNYRNMK
jgi:hypothetical protein